MEPIPSEHSIGLCKAFLALQLQFPEHPDRNQWETHEDPSEGHLLFEGTFDEGRGQRGEEQEEDVDPVQVSHHVSHLGMRADLDMVADFLLDKLSLGNLWGE